MAKVLHVAREVDEEDLKAAIGSWVVGSRRLPVIMHSSCWPRVGVVPKKRIQQHLEAGDALLGGHLFWGWAAALVDLDVAVGVARFWEQEGR